LKTEYVNELIENRDFSHENLTGNVFYRCTLAGCKFIETILDNTEFENCKFVECNLTNPRIDQALFLDLQFEKSRIMGLSFINCRQMTFDFVFKDCIITNCNFSSLIMKKSRFLKCEITECYFQESNLEEVSFDDSLFRDTMFHKTRLRDASFINSSGYAINPVTNDIRNAKFTVPDVLGLLGGFGIEIVDG